MPNRFLVFYLILIYNVNAYLKQKNKGLAFDSNTKKCNYASEVKCVRKSDSSCESDHMTPVAGSLCRSFILCLQNERKIIACPAGFFHDCIII